MNESIKSMTPTPKKNNWKHLKLLHTSSTHTLTCISLSPYLDGCLLPWLFRRSFFSSAWHFSKLSPLLLCSIWYFFRAAWRGQHRARERFKYQSPWMSFIVFFLFFFWNDSCTECVIIQTAEWEWIYVTCCSSLDGSRWEIKEKVSNPSLTLREHRINSNFTWVRLKWWGAESDPP